MCAKYIMDVLEVMIIVLLLLVLFILLSHQSQPIPVPVPVPIPAPAPDQKHKKNTSGCRDTGYGCCPYSEIPKLNEIGSNCRYQN